MLRYQDMDSLYSVSLAYKNCTTALPWVYIVVSRATTGFLECIASRISSDILRKTLFVDIARIARYEGDNCFEAVRVGLHLRELLPKDRESILGCVGRKSGSVAVAVG